MHLWTLRRYPRRMNPTRSSLGRRASLALVAAAFLLGAGCGNDSSAGDDGSESSSAQETEAAFDVVIGPVVKVKAESLGDVDSIEVREEGVNVEITIDPEAEYDYNLGHITEHLGSGEPLRVGVQERDGQLVATSIADLEGDH